MDNKLIYNKAASLATASDRESYKEMNFIYKFIKRVLDIVCSILGIIVLSPILVIVSIEFLSTESASKKADDIVTTFSLQVLLHLRLRPDILSPLQNIST